LRNKGHPHFPALISSISFLVNLYSASFRRGLDQQQNSGAARMRPRRPCPPPKETWENYFDWCFISISNY